MVRRVIIWEVSDAGAIEMCREAIREAIITGKDLPTEISDIFEVEDRGVREDGAHVFAVVWA